MCDFFRVNNDVIYEAIRTKERMGKKLMDCRDIEEKIVVLEDLRPEEREEVACHVRDCKACADRLQDFGLILSTLTAIKPATHLAHDLLTRYVVYLEDPETPDFDGRELNAHDIKTIEAHLSECIACQKTVGGLRHEYKELSNHLQETVLAEITQTQPQTDYVTSFMQRMKRSLDTILNVPLPRLYPAIAGTLAVLTLVVWYGPFLRSDNPYSDMVQVQFEEQHFATRGQGQADLEDGLAAFNEDRFDDAIVALETYLGPESGGKTNRAFGESVLGMAYLKKARRDFLGRFVRIDVTSLDKAISHLAQAAESTENVQIKENSYWYLANAHLLREQADLARESLLKTLALKGRRANSAEKLLQELQ